MASRRARALFFFGVMGPISAAAAVACSDFTDDGVTPEAGVGEGGDAAIEAAPGPFCLAHPDAGICADFDQGDPVTFHFTKGSGDIRVDDATAVSRPGAMVAVASPGGVSAWVEGNAVGSAYASRQRFGFDTYQGAFGGDAGDGGAPGTTQDAIISSVAQPGTSCTFDIEFIDASRARLDMAYPDGDGGIEYGVIDLTAFPPPRTWARVETLLEQGSGVVLVTVKVNDAVGLDRRETKCPQLSSQPFVKVGLLHPNGAPPLTGEARFDNVLLVPE